jgi:hypothetical protein
VIEKVLPQLEKSTAGKLEATVTRQLKTQFQTTGKQALIVSETDINEIVRRTQCNLQSVVHVVLVMFGFQRHLTNMILKVIQK